jgi:putative addiction module component (TIGR02574 family)
MASRAQLSPVTHPVQGAGDYHSPQPDPFGAHPGGLAVRAERAIVAVMSTVAEIATAFEKLSLREQAQFAEWYEARLAQVGPDLEIDQLWAAEAQRRLEEIRSGKVQAIPGEPVMAELRRRYAS